MSLEDFQLLDNEQFDNSIIKRDFTKIYKIIARSAIEPIRSKY